MRDLFQKNSNYIEFLVHWAIQDMRKAYMKQIERLISK
jgi:hypothetical protein